MKVRICRNFGLPVPEGLPEACRSSDHSKQASELVVGLAAHAPSYTKLMRITLGEQTGS